MYIISISKILVYFRKENNTKLDKLIAFIKLRDELILKGGVISQFPDTKEGIIRIQHIIINRTSTRTN